MSSSATRVTERRSEGPGRGDATPRIGPNAVLQLKAALDDLGRTADIPRLFSAAGISDWLETPPTDMVDERRVARLHREVWRTLSEAEARSVMAGAGRRTADYLLAHRIPQPARFMLRWMPPRMAAAALTAAIRANAWTFAGSARFEARSGRSTRFSLTGNPFCAPYEAGERAPDPRCAWHAAVFQRLFEVLVSPGACVTETHCEARGDEACRFEAEWRDGRRRPTTKRDGIGAAPCRIAVPP